MFFKHEKILCIQLRQIGDVLMTTPAVRALAETYPDAEIDFLTEIPAHQVYEFNPKVHRTIKIKRKNTLGEWADLIKTLRQNRYSMVVDFLGLPKTAFLSWITGAGIRIGFDFRGRSLFYTDVVPLPEGMHYAPLHKLHLLSKLNITDDNARLEFHITPQDRQMAKQILEKVGVEPGRPLITLSPVSRREYKVWPAKHFAQVCDYLISRYDAQILFLWGPGEYEFVRDVREKMEFPSLPGYDVPTLRETAALCELADLHIGNDNGPMHFAIAVGCRTVAIFGRPLAENWTPPDSSKHLAVEFDPGCKRSCHYPQCGLECINNLPVESVIPAIDQQMKQILSLKP